jgi:hypothetical protein
VIISGPFAVSSVHFSTFIQTEDSGWYLTAPTSWSTVVVVAASAVSSLPATQVIAVSSSASLVVVALSNVPSTVQNT